MSHEAPTVEEYLNNKSKKRSYEKVPIGRFNNILLAVDKGSNPDISQDELRRLVKVGRQSVSLFRRIRTMTRQRSIIYDDLRKGAIDHPGFAGFDMPDSKAKVRISPEDEITWNGPALKEILGKSASAVVSEQLEMTCVVPLGHVMPGGEVLTSEKAMAVFYSGLLALGFSEQDDATILSGEIKYKVDEEVLTEMVNSGQIGSIEGTAVVKRKFTPDIDTP